MLSYSVDFKAPRELWNLLGKAVPDKFHRSGGHRKHNCWQNRANFHRSRAWRIVVILTLHTERQTRVLTIEFVVSRQTLMPGHSYLYTRSLPFCKTTPLDILSTFSVKIFYITEFEAVNLKSWNVTCTDNTFNSCPFNGILSKSLSRRCNAQLNVPQHRDWLTDWL